MTRFLTLKIPPRAALAAAALVFIASLVSGREQADTAPPARPAERAAPVESLACVDIAKLKRSGQPGAVNDVLAARSLAAPAPAASGAPNPAAAPTAPALPFRYLGKMNDGEKTLVFVGRGEEHYSVEPGLTIDTYRVEQVTDTAITFVFLPLGTRQVLELAAAG
jgi:hypothetical protein